jgi:hypothetical protein
MLARLEGRGVPQGLEAGEAAALDAATLCREATVLLRYISSRQWPAGRVVANGAPRWGLPAQAGGAPARRF